MSHDTVQVVAPKDLALHRFDPGQDYRRLAPISAFRRPYPPFKKELSFVPFQPLELKIGRHIACMYVEMVRTIVPKLRIQIVRILPNSNTAQQRQLQSAAIYENGVKGVTRYKKVFPRWSGCATKPKNAKIAALAGIGKSRISDYLRDTDKELARPYARACAFTQTKNNAARRPCLTTRARRNVCLSPTRPSPCTSPVNCERFHYISICTSVCALNFQF